MRRRELVAAGAAVALGTMTLGAWGRRKRQPGEIDLWFSYGGNNRKVLLDLVAAFHRAQSEVRVRPVFQGDYFEGLAKLRAGLFVGSVPTVTHVVGEVIPYLFEAGVLETLDGIDESDLVPELSQRGTFIGGSERPLVALPFNRSTPICYYHRTLFDSLGLSPPTTWDEMREVARRATLRRDSVERWGYSCPLDWWFWTALVGQAGGRVIEADGTVSLGGEAGARAIELWQAMVHDDRSMKPPPGRDYNAWEVTNSDFLAGRVAMIWTSTAFLRYLEDNAAFPVGAAPLPRLERASVPTGGTFFVMPRGLSEEERRAGAVFLRWMLQPAQANAWATRTGYMTVSRRGRTALEDYYRTHPNDRVAVDQLAHAMPWPWEPQLFRVQREALQPRLEQAVLERRDALQTLGEARAALAQP